MKYKAFHKLSYGLYIIASEFEGSKSGYIANTAFQVTSSPAQLAISAHKDNETTDVILKSKAFSVSVLKKNVDTSIIGEFGFMSSRDFDKFRKINSEVKTSGAPVVTDQSIAWFDCKVVSHVDVGSHILIIGEVLDSDVISDEEALSYAYYREKYKMLAPKNAPTYIEKDKLEEEIEQTEPKVVVEEKEIEGALDKHICNICGFVYDPEVGDPSAGIEPGTPFEDLPEDYKCPICNAGTDYFNKL